VKNSEIRKENQKKAMIAASIGLLSGVVLAFVMKTDNRGKIKYAFAGATLGAIAGVVMANKPKSNS